MCENLNFEKLALNGTQWHSMALNGTLKTALRCDIIIIGKAIDKYTAQREKSPWAFLMPNGGGHIEEKKFNE